MSRLPILTLGVGAMKGYSDEKGSPLKSDHIQKWFAITTPITMLWVANQMDKNALRLSARIAAGILGGAFLAGFSYCVGSKFGHIAAEFTDGAHPLPSGKGLPLRVPLLLPPPPPLTSWPSVASPAVLSDSHTDSSYTGTQLR
jgi:hypothetical protein